MPDALFDVDPAAAPEPPAKLTTGERMRRRQAAAIRHGQHPLVVALRISIRLHPDASRDPDDREALRPRCGTCRFRDLHNAGTAQSFTKCWLPGARPSPVGYPRITGGPGTDVRAWWPACSDYQPKETS